MGARILFYDIEVTPILGWTYGMFEKNVVKVERPSYLMCFSYKWMGEDKVHNVAQPDFRFTYKEDPYSDEDVAIRLWHILDEADVVIGHYVGRFDNRVANARFLANGLGAPSPYRTVDTLKSVRSFAKFGSNSLNALCEELELGAKPDSTHGKLWHDCVNGDMKAWELMKTYCNTDVELTESLYNELLPFISNHPNMAVLDGYAGGCPRCGSIQVQSRGYVYTNAGRFRRVFCSACHSWSRERLSPDKPVFRPDYVNVPR